MHDAGAGKLFLVRLTELVWRQYPDALNIFILVAPKGAHLFSEHIDKTECRYCVEAVKHLACVL